MNIAFVIGTFVVSAILCHFVAKNRGANPIFWGVMGVIFGPLAIPFVFFSKAGGND